MNAILAGNLGIYCGDENLSHLAFVEMYFCKIMNFVLSIKSSLDLFFNKIYLIMINYLSIHDTLKVEYIVKALDEKQYSEKCPLSVTHDFQTAEQCVKSKIRSEYSHIRVISKSVKGDTMN